MRRKGKAKFILTSEENKNRIVELIKDLISMRKQNRLRVFLEHIHPKDMALLWNLFDRSEQEFLLSMLRVEKSAELISELLGKDREKILRGKNTEWLIDRLEELETDDVVDILKELPSGEVDFIIKKFDKEYSEKIKQLITYPEETAGSLMNSDFFAVNWNASINTIIKLFRKFVREKEDIGHIQFIYVVDKNDHLQGYIPIRKLIMEKPNKKAKDIMRPIPVIITPYMDQEAVANVFKNHNLLVLPVVDEEGKLLGRITIDDVVDVIEEEASEDVFKLVGLNLEKSIGHSVMHSFNSRLPWLLIHLSTSILSALVIQHFQPTLEKYVVLVFFMPVIAALGGATGSQMVAMIVRGLTIGEIHLRQVKWFLVRELGAVFLNSLVIGLLAAFFSYMIYNEIKFGLLVFSALILNMLLATITGVAIPFFLKLFKFDPATGGAIMVTALTDIFGFYIFLALATIFLNYG